MRKLPILLVGVVMLALPAGALASSQTFSATADTYVDSSHPTTNFGSGTHLWIKWTSPVQRTYLKFNVSLPSGSTITGATLRMYVGSGSTFAGYDVWSEANTSWAESGLTYSNSPAFGTKLGNSGGWPSGNVYVPFVMPSGSITPGVNALGLERPSTAVSAYDFYSREAGQPPQLVVTYDTPPPPPPPPTGTAPPLRFVYNTDSASAPYGFNLMDVSSKSEADGTPSGTKGLIWVGDYDNSTCQFEVTDSQIQAQLAGNAGDAKIAGYFFSDEPDPAACPNAPAQHAARSALIHRSDADPGHLTLMVMDSNSGSASLNQVPLWKGAADYVGLDPYPCYQGQSCDFSWIDQIISAANAAGLNYWGVVQAFNDSTWRWPTTDELQHMISQWAASNWKGFAVFAWTWDGFNLSDHPDLLSVLQNFNATAGNPPPPPPDTTPPSTPTNFAAGTATQTSIPATWTASTDNVGVAGYETYVNGNKVASPSGTSFTFTGLTCGTSYTLAVDAFDAAGNTSAKATTMASTAACSPPPPPPTSPHIMVILMENHSVGAVVGNSTAPFQNSLTTSNITLTNWTSIDHPSSPNYCAFVTGQDSTCAGDCNPSIGSSCDYRGDNLGNQMFAAGVPAKWFAEDLSGNGCSIANSESGNNDVNHEPWAYMDAWQANAGACAQAGLTTASPGDASVISAISAASPPSFVWVTPNLTDDTHDGTVAQGDTYLHNLVTAVQGTSWYAAGGTIVITYDEDEGTSPPQGGSNPSGYCTNTVAGSDSECVPTFIISAKDANVGAVSIPGNHYGMLRSLEECYGLPLLNNAANPAFGDIKNRLCG